MSTYTPSTAIIDASPGLADALAGLAAAEAEHAAIERPARSVDEVSQLKQGASTEREPRPGVSFAEWDEVRVAHDLYNTARARATAKVDAARKRVDELLYGIEDDDFRLPAAQRAAAREAIADRHAARRAALMQRIRIVEADLETKSLTAAERRVLDAERRSLAVFVILHGESLRDVLNLSGVAATRTVRLPSGRLASLRVTADRVEATHSSFSSYDDEHVPLADVLEAVTA